MKNKLHILVLLSFLSGIIAPACGFAWGGTYSVVEICTAQGFENRIVMNEGQGDSPSHQMQEQCEFCFSKTHLTAYITNSALFEKIYTKAEKQRFRLYQDIVASRYATNTSSRGPPSLI
jgi:hypothetical protein